MTSESLRPRFLPDPDFRTEWGHRGAWIAAAIRRGYSVPPLAAFGVSQVREWLSGNSTEMPGHWPLVTQTLKDILTGGEDWPLLLTPDCPPGRITQTRRLEGGFSETDLWSAWQSLFQENREVRSILVRPEIMDAATGILTNRPESVLTPLPEVRAPLLELQKELSRWLNDEFEAHWAWDGETLWITALTPQRLSPPPARSLLRELFERWIRPW